LVDARRCGAERGATEQMARPRGRERAEVGVEGELLGVDQAAVHVRGEPLGVADVDVEGGLGVADGADKGDLLIVDQRDREVATVHGQRHARLEVRAVQPDRFAAGNRYARLAGGRAGQHDEVDDDRRGDVAVRVIEGRRAAVLERDRDVHRAGRRGRSDDRHLPGLDLGHGARNAVEVDGKADGEALAGQFHFVAALRGTERGQRTGLLGRHRHLGEDDPCIGGSAASSAATGGQERTQRKHDDSADELPQVHIYLRLGRTAQERTPLLGRFTPTILRMGLASDQAE
jgi:hypothetical protein